VITELDVELPDGRRVRAADTGEAGGPRAVAPLTVVWHHGSPHTGALYEPLLGAAAARAIRLVSYARPSYGGSTPQPGRSVTSAAADVVAVADALGIDRFAVMGTSGGGPHALACAALVPERVTGVVTLASPAPYTDAFDWFDGMRSPGALRAARQGRAARAAFADEEEFDPEVFVPADWAALEGRWSAVLADVQASDALGPDGLIDDDVALASPWGFEVSDVAAPTLLVHGELDRMIPRRHASWLLGRIPGAKLWARLDDGHVSVLDVVPDALDWLLEAAAPARS
jgi:pimeloyl-ACP methyl ester carboxylesterase